MPNLCKFSNDSSSEVCKTLICKYDAEYNLRFDAMDYIAIRMKEKVRD